MDRIILIFLPFKNITFVYKAKGDYNEALEYFTKCLSVKLITLGVDHPEVANAYSKIGKVYMAMGEVDRAMEYQFYSMNPAIGCLESRIGNDSGTDDSVQTLIPILIPHDADSRFHGPLFSFIIVCYFLSANFLHCLHIE